MMIVMINGIRLFRQIFFQLIDQKLVVDKNQCVNTHRVQSQITSVMNLNYMQLRTITAKSDCLLSQYSL